ncbi:FkbM family methyltransferase [Maribacter sp. 2-571]|uniref:FkbM family methyltransferase n=1 Tax=Maribacter sp. 2-571 TaxID=3417569 RepID=UPI003D351EA6
MLKKFIFIPVLRVLRTMVLPWNQILVKLFFDRDKLDNFLKKTYPIKTQLDLIRVGSDNDAGYLIPNDLEEIGLCFSPGVDFSASFEKELFDKYYIKSYLCDYSVDGPPIKSKGLDFVKKYLGSYEDQVYTTLENWVNANKTDNRDAILQMDIEGGEYDVIIHTDKDFFKQFRIIVIEFHNLDQLLTSVGFRTISSVFNKLLKNFAVVHIHPNNDRRPIKVKGYTIPYVMEYTFLRKDRIDEFDYERRFPNPLDMDNYLNRKPLPLPRIFYKTS